MGMFGSSEHGFDTGTAATLLNPQSDNTPTIKTAYQSIFYIHIRHLFKCDFKDKT